MTSNMDNQSLYEKKRIRCAKTLVWAGFLVYVLMMGSKNVITAEVVSLMDVFGTTKAQTSLSMTYYFITYAIAQVLLTFIMPKLNLRIFLTISGGLSAIATIIMGFSKTIELLYVMCALNGIFTAGIYSGCMASFSKYLPSTLLPFANKIMTAGTAVWGALSYGLPPLFVGHGLWNAPFIILGALFLISVVFFFIVFSKMRKYPQQISNDKKTTFNDEKPYINIKNNSGVITYFAIMLCFSFLGNTVHYMVMNWIPNMLYEVFYIPQSYSILITLIVPLISVAGSIYSINLCQRYNNIFIVSAVFSALSALTLIPMIFIFDKNVVLSIVLLGLFVAFATGGRSIFTGVLAFKMRSKINSGSYLAAVNAVAAVMAGVVPPITGNIIDAFSGVSGYGVSYLIASALIVVYVVSTLLYSAWFNKTKTRKN